MKTKSKALLLTLCAVLLVAASVLGTMAYLTSTDTVTNTFTVGKVEIKLDETDVTNPNGPRVKANSYKLMPGTTYTKDPTVTVLKGSEDSYVRMKVTFNNAAALMEMLLPNAEDFDDDADALALAKKLAPMLYLTNFTAVDSVWLPDINMMYGENTVLADPNYFVYDAANDTVTYIFYYPAMVKAKDVAAGDLALEPIFTEISLPEHVTGEQLAKLNNFQITVIAEAIQAGSFANAGAAWAAFAPQP